MRLMTATSHAEAYALIHTRFEDKIPPRHIVLYSTDRHGLVLVEDVVPESWHLLETLLEVMTDDARLFVLQAERGPFPWMFNDQVVERPDGIVHAYHLPVARIKEMMRSREAGLDRSYTVNGTAPFLTLLEGDIAFLTSVCHETVYVTSCYDDRGKISKAVLSCGLEEAEDVVNRTHRETRVTRVRVTDGVAVTVPVTCEQETRYTLIEP